MSTNADIVKLLNELIKDVNTLKKDVALLVDHESKEKDMFKILNAKLDLFKNLDASSQEATASKSKTATKPTKPTFFKQIFLDDRDKYLNSLYTQDEIDEVYKTEEVIKKKKPDEKATKAASLLYTKHIKADNPSGRASAFESVYSNIYG